MTNQQNEKPPTLERLSILLHAGFFLVGVATVLLGQILPFLARRFDLGDRDAGFLFAAQFAGSLLGTLFYSRLVEKYGYAKLLAGGFCLSAFGCAALNFDSYYAAAAAIFVSGAGVGALIPATNLLIVELRPQKSAAALNFINFFWGAGAISCKPFVDFAGSPGSVFLPTILLSVFLLAAAFALSNFQQTGAVKARRETVSGFDAAPIWTTATARLIAAFAFLHVGVESAVGGWLTTYQLRVAGGTGVLPLSAALVFFLFLVVGRGVAPLFFRFASENAVLSGGLAVMTAGITAALAATDSTFLITGAALLGFGSAAIFPTNMSRFAKIFGADSVNRATPLFVCGSLGGAFATWLVGYVSTVYASLRIGFSVVLIGCLLLAVLQFVLARVKTNEGSAAV